MASWLPETLGGPGGAGWVRKIARPLITFPRAIIGAAVHYPTFRLIRFIATRFTRGQELVATTKAVGGLILYPLTYIVCGVIAGWRFGLAYGIVTALVLPLLGYVALRFFEQLDDVIGRTRALTWRIARRSAFERLMRTRGALRDEIVALAHEMCASRSFPPRAS